MSEFHDVKVITFKLTEGPNVEGCGRLEIYRVRPRLVLFRVPFSYSFVKILSKLDFDILHAHGAIPCLSDLSVLHAKLLKRKVAYTHHFDGNVQDSRAWNLLANFYNHTAGRFTARFSDAIVATSRSYAETSPVLKPYMDRVSIIPCCVDHNFFRPQPGSAIDSLRRYLGLAGKNVILFVGRIVPYKGLEYLVEALEYVYEDDKNTHLLVIGEGEGKRITDGSSYYQKIRHHANKDGLKDRVSFLGRIEKDALPQYYALADVLVLPSVARGEAFGTAMLEALSCGTPVVASNLPGMRDVLKGNDSIGCYVPPRDSYALAQAIIKMQERKTDARGLLCRHFAVDNYSIGRVVGEYVDLYGTLEECM